MWKGRERVELMSPMKVMTRSNLQDIVQEGMDYTQYTGQEVDDAGNYRTIIMRIRLFTFDNN